jgi:hypothetical protein
LSLDQFLAKRGGSAIIARGRALKQSHAALFASIQQRYGVPPGPLLAIWGMETGFGRERGNQHTLSAVATLAYDCRRAAYFTEQLYAALTLIDRGILSVNTRGSMHGEVGHTQFLPKSILNYGTGGSLDNSGHALAATANFLRGHGWRAGAGYQPGEAISELSRLGMLLRSINGPSRLLPDRLMGEMARPRGAERRAVIRIIANLGAAPAERRRRLARQGRQSALCRSSKVESAERATLSSRPPDSMPLIENSMTASNHG